MMKIHATRVIIGLIGLCVGTLVYLIDRPAEKTYFVSHSPIDISLYHSLPMLFGRIGNSLPTFSHAFAFILITTGLLNSSKKECVIITLSWCFLDSAFEIGQQFGAYVTPFIPKGFDGIPFLENTKNYFTFGTFDWFDMAAILAGSALACAVCLKTDKKPIIQV